MLVLALLSALGGSEATIRELMGYEEGARRTVRCKDGGYFNGIEASFATLSGFTERVAIGIRLRCSTGVLDVEYLGEVPDSHEFGANYAGGTPLKVECPKGKGIARIQWRRGEIQGKDDQAWKPGGMQVYCGTETMNAITMDNQVGKTYALTDVQCSKTADPPLATQERHAVEVDVWEEIDWVGLRIVKCVAAGSRAV